MKEKNPLFQLSSAESFLKLEKQVGSELVKPVYWQLIILRYVELINRF